MRLVIHGEAPSGLLDAYGRFIDGDHNGTAGGDAVEILTKNTAHIVVPPPKHKKPSKHKAVVHHMMAHAVHDAALSAGALVAHNHAHRFEVDLAMAAVHHDRPPRGG